MAALMRLSRLFAGLKYNNPVINHEINITQKYIYEIPCRRFSVVPNRSGKCFKNVEVYSRTYATNVAVATSSSPSNSTPMGRVPRETASHKSAVQLLKDLDQAVKRFGRIDKEQVENLITLLKSPLASNHCVILLRCCGSWLKKESVSSRIDLAEKMWQKILKIGEVNIQVYNAMLHARLQNKQTFVPADVLSDIENVQHLVPNRMTYQLLLMQFCELGDIDGASKILDHMRTTNLPINEAILNSVLKGQMRKGDLDAAKAVLNTMSGYGLDPTADTYETFMCCLAEKGDLPAIKQAISDAEKNDIIIVPANFCNIIFSLVTSGHEDKIDDIIQYIEKYGGDGYNQDKLNCAYRLIASGHEDAAFQFYSKLLPKEEPTRAGSNFLRVLVINGLPLDKVLKIVQKFNPVGSVQENVESMALFSLLYQRFEYSLNIYDHMKEQGIPVKQHYYWPLFHKATENKDINGIYAIVKNMIKNVNDTPITGTLTQWVVAGLLKNNESLDVILGKLKECGIDETSLQILHTSTLFTEGKFLETAKLIDNGFSISPIILRAVLSTTFEKSKYDYVNLMQFFKSMEKARPSGLIFSEMIFSLLRWKNMTTELADKLANAWIESGLKVGNKFIYPLVQQLIKLKVPDETIAKVELKNNQQSHELTREAGRTMSEKEEFITDCGNILSSDGTGKRLSEYKRLSIEDMELDLSNNKRHDFQLELLKKYCTAGMVEKAVAMKTSLDSQNFIYSADMLRRLGVLIAKDKKDLPEALKYYEQIEKQHPQFSSYGSLTLYISDLMIKDNKYEDAVNLLKNYSAKHKDDFVGNAEYIFSNLCCDLLQSCSENYDSKKILDLMNLLFDCGFTKPEMYKVLDKTMAVLIEKSDSEEIVSFLERCVTVYNKAPRSSIVFKHLIQNEDAGRLQKVVDLVTTLNGEMVTLLQLVICFIECDKPKQARKILETPGLKIRHDMMNEQCRQLVNTKKKKVPTATLR